jgi:AcrR family transcriptional regulator
MTACDRPSGYYRSVVTASTRERLLEAACELIERGGEASVRIDAVANAAGVKRPSIYHFFGDRDGLIIAAQAERYRHSILFGMADQIELTRRCASRRDFIELVRHRMTELTSADGEERRRIRMDVLGSAASRPELRALVAAADTEASQHLGQLLGIAHSQGWLTTTFDLEVAGLWWFGMMNGRYLVEGPQSTLVRREWDAIALDLVLRLLFGKPADLE